MELINTTGMCAAYTQGVEPSGREWLVVVVKGTFGIPEQAGLLARLHPEQMPMVTADTFTGEPGFSAPVQEVDFALRKPRCDILLTGSAWAPHGAPAERVLVGARVGAWQKTFAVVGNRHWGGLSGTRASAPEPFVKMPISYDRAFGGLDARHEDPAEHGAYMRNPVGRGWHRRLEARYVDGTPLPNTEEKDLPVTAPDGKYAPMAFGPVGRGWASRLPFAGTYDQDWIDNVFPFLPADFQDAYYQAAPLDQQLDYPMPGTLDVALANLTRNGQERFKLPCRELPVTFFRRRGGHEEVKAVLDTIAFDTDRRLVTLAWRAAMPLKKNMFEISNVLAGTMSSGWWRARALGKTWHPSLGELVQSRRGDEVEATS